MLWRRVRVPSVILLCSIPGRSVPQFFHPLIYRWAPRVFPALGYCLFIFFAQAGWEDVVGISTPAPLTSLLVAHTSAIHPGVRAASDALVSWVRAVLTASV